MPDTIWAMAGPCTVLQGRGKAGHGPEPWPCQAGFNGPRAVPGQAHGPVQPARVIRSQIATPSNHATPRDLHR